MEILYWFKPNENCAVVEMNDGLIFANKIGASNGTYDFSLVANKCTKCLVCLSALYKVNGLSIDRA